MTPGDIRLAWLAAPQCEAVDALALLALDLLEQCEAFRAGERAAIDVIAKRDKTVARLQAQNQALRDELRRLTKLVPERNQFRRAAA